MTTVGGPDYTKCSLEELIDVQDRIDRAAYPDRAASLDKEIARRLAARPGEPGSPGVGTVGLRLDEPIAVKPGRALSMKNAVGSIAGMVIGISFGVYGFLKGTDEGWLMIALPVMREGRLKDRRGDVPRGGEAMTLRRFPTRHAGTLAAVFLVAVASAVGSTTAGASAAAKPRARDLGIRLDGTPGQANAITDVAGVEVGYSTLIADTPSGEGRKPAAIRTGVTAVLPRGKGSSVPVFAGWFSLNGNGEMTGTTWIEESGLLDGPVMITNTHSVGVVRDAVVEWSRLPGKTPTQEWSLPVVAETWDGWLNDINGFHVRREHAFEALDTAHAGPIAEGNVGGGTGMICYEFKCGTGTASRVLAKKSGGYTVGVLVQANHGLRYQLLVGGVPVGRTITEGAPYSKGADLGNEKGSIIIVVATDAPLLPHQLKRLARRASLGLARTGAISGNGSGDIFIAFSTANPQASRPEGESNVTLLANGSMNPLFVATIQATEEAIINALVAAGTMTGLDGHTVIAIPHDRLRAAVAGGPVPAQ